MAVKIKKETTTEVDEKKKTEEWRRFIFRKTWEENSDSEVIADDIEALVRSDATWKQLETLLKNNCPPELIIKILT